MAVTVTPGKAPPVESLISPRIVPVAVWARAGEANRVRPSKTAPAMNRYVMVDLRNTATFSLAPGPHPRRELTLMPRLGFARPRLGMAAGAFQSRWPPPQRELTLMPRLGFARPRLGMAAGAFQSRWPHPQRELTLMPRLGFARPRLGMAAGAFQSRWPHPQRELTLTPRLGFRMASARRATPARLPRWGLGVAPGATIYNNLARGDGYRDRYTSEYAEREMKKLLVASVAAWLCSWGLSAQSPQTGRRTPAANAESATQTVKQYCIGCHSDRGKAGGLSLADFDVARTTEHPDAAEKMIRKLRAGMMPPAGARRPDDPTLQDLRRALETRMDQWAAANPNPGWRPFQRLTRAEYGRAVKDLLDVDVDVTAYLPPDTMSQGFDNIADAQSFSPALPQGYLRAASQISRLAVGDRTAAPTTATYRVLATENQMRYVEGTPFGSRGGTAFVHTFPADGLYKFQATLVRTVSGELFGNTAIYMAGKNELLEISINGERAAGLEVDSGMSDAGEKGLTLETPPIAIKAGPQRIAAAFVPRSVAPVDDLLAPIDQTLIDTRIGTGYGVTMAPHLQELAIAGPVSVTGVSETPSRRKIFTCRPAPAAPAAQERSCATDILRR